MSLKSTYLDFLRNPSTGILAENASLVYVPTLTSISEPTAILKHLAALNKQVRKKDENVLSAVEGWNGVTLEVETTLEFLTGGGTYLPGLDDNFLVDKAVTFPVLHFVSFDADHKVTSIRLHWDQGSLLKQVDVIGSRNRSWPIRDGKEQIKLIISVVGTPEPSTASERRSIQSDARPAVRSHASSVTSVFTNEPRSLSLFENASHTEDEVPTSAGGPVVSPRAAAKPPSRGLEAILSGDGEEPVEQPEFRSPSPKKQFNGQGGTQRHGSEKHFQPIRLFDENDAPPNAKSPDAFKTDPRKYQHFEFGSGEDAVRLSTKQTNKTKHGSQWDFNDFMTPDKPREPRLRTQDVRNFGWEDNEEKSPVRRPVVHHARPDAETHFEFVDDGTPEPSKARPTSKGRQHNEGLGLYRDNVLDPDGAAAPGKQPLAHTSVNVNADSRHRDFDSKFEMVDDSPSTRAAAAAARNDENAPAQPAPKKIDDNRAKVVKMMASSWQSYDDGAEGAPAARKENAAAAAPPHDEKKVRRDAERHWGFGDDDADVVEEHSKKIVPSGAPQAAEKSFWDF